MKIIFFGKGNRGVSCLKALNGKHDICLIIAHQNDKLRKSESIQKLGEEYGIDTFSPDDPNDRKTELLLRTKNADIFVLAGYGKILKRKIFEIPKKMTINLHGGKLPKYRGSSPLNWALINGENKFTISIIKVDEKVDSGDIISEKTFPIGPDDDINDLHRTANIFFPKMLNKALDAIDKGKVRLKKQGSKKVSYYPLRFPDDGLIIWDLLTAKQIHDRIRALTRPYPCAFTYYKGRKILLLKSKMHKIGFFGSPGRIYKISEEGILVCAADKCLVIEDAIFEDNGQKIENEITRYERFATIGELMKKD